MMILKCLRYTFNVKQGNRRYHTSSALCTPSLQSPLSRPIMNFQWGRKPFPATSDAAYHKHAGGRRSHGHRQRAQKLGKDRAWRSGDILSDRQTDTQRQTHSSQYFATALGGEVANKKKIQQIALVQCLCRPECIDQF